MKAIIKKSAYIFLAISFILTSCKKGEEDPFFSLKSRKARLKGEWKLTDIEGAHTNDNYSYTSSYSDGVRTDIRSDGDINSYRFNLDFKFDGKKNFKQFLYFSYLDNSYFESETLEGVYAFEGASKNDNLKSKEAIILYASTDIYESSDSESYETKIEGDPSYPIQFRIIRLTNKEMILDVSQRTKSQYTYESGTTINSQSNGTERWTLKKK
jgi:hypothetical protein